MSRSSADRRPGGGRRESGPGSIPRPESADESDMAPVPTQATAGDAAGIAAADLPSALGPRRRAPEPINATTVHGGAAVALSLPFLGTGVWIALIAAGVVEVAESRHAGTRAIAAAASALFSFGGLWILAHGVRGVLRARRARADAARFPHAPWRYDRDWHRDGEDARRWRATLAPAAGTLVFATFAAIPALLASAAPDAPFVVYAAAVGMALLTLVPGVHLVIRVLQAIRFGPTYVRWGRFPAFLGEELTLRFGVQRDDLGFERLTFRLRCVEERHEKDAEGTQRVVCRVLHEEQHSVVEGAGMPRPKLDAVVRFRLPEGGPANDLLARPARWWELEVEGECDGPDYRERFLLPVYARADEAADARPSAAARVPAASAA